jgi:hypothetical protein
MGWFPLLILWIWFAHDEHGAAWLIPAFVLMVLATETSGPTDTYHRVRRWLDRSKA